MNPHPDPHSLQDWTKQKSPDAEGVVAFSYRDGGAEAAPDVDAIQKQMAIVAWQPGVNRVVQVPAAGELAALGPGAVVPRTPARPPPRRGSAASGRRFAPNVFGQRVGGAEGPLLPHTRPPSQQPRGGTDADPALSSEDDELAGGGWGGWGGWTGLRAPWGDPAWLWGLGRPVPLPPPTLTLCPPTLTLCPGPAHLRHVGGAVLACRGGDPPSGEAGRVGGGPTRARAAGWVRPAVT